jgi:ACS family glucarate transporter-like MFS transporter
LDTSSVTSADETHPKIQQRVADVRHRESLVAVQKEIERTEGLDVLVNAHGLQIRSDFAGCDEDTWMTLTDINLNGVYRCCQVFGEPMRTRGGAIVSIGSVNGVVASGMLLGGALTPPLLVELTAYYGWKGAILWTALPAALLTAGWAWYGRDRPQQHPKVTAEEITELDEAPAAPPLTFRRMGQVLVNRNILLLALSYLCMNYVFYMISYWSFLYLVKERHLSGLESGLMAMAPWIGAAVGAAIGGVMADGLVIRMGATRGYRLLPLLTLPIGAVLLYLTPTIASVYVAVAALTVAFFAMEVNEGPYWAATMNVARADTGAATGVLNTGGNMGGMLCQPVVAALAAAGAWHGVWISGAVFAALAAVLWLFVNAEPAEAVAK